MLDFARARRTMVDSQLRPFDITDRAVLAAMGEVRRELFVPKGQEILAYTDRETPLDEMPLARAPGSRPRAMMAPMILGRLLQALRIEAGMAVLDVGCGLGYAASVLGRLGASVTALESSAAMAEVARERLGAEGIAVAEGPLLAGPEGTAAFDRILVEGTVESRPERLLARLAEGGRLACVMAQEGAQGGGRGGGRAGKATLFVRSSGGIGATILFDAHAPRLAEFEDAPAFVF